MGILAIIGLALYAVAALATLAATVWYVGFVAETVLNGRPGRVLYHGSNVREQGNIVASVIEEFIPAPERSAYELIEPGAGMAIMAHALAGRFPWKRVRAIELGPFIYFAGRLRYLFHPSGRNVAWELGDLFAAEYPAPAVVYCYLFPQLITRLWQEGKLKGCLVISLTFPITGLEPTRTIELQSWQKRLFVYDLR